MYEMRDRIIEYLVTGGLKYSSKLRLLSDIFFSSLQLI